MSAAAWMDTPLLVGAVNQLEGHILSIEPAQPNKRSTYTASRYRIRPALAHFH